MTTTYVVEAAILAKLRPLAKGRPSKGWQPFHCPGPIHRNGDANTSGSFTVGEDGSVGIKCHAGDSVEDIVASLGLTMRDLYPPTSRNGYGSRPAGSRRIVATYPYHDADGTYLYDVVRFEPKDFRQRRADGRWSMEGVKRVPYRLPELLASTRGVVIVEGEKDVDRVASLGIVATTNPGGAGKWRPEFAEYLVGRNVVLIPDNDKPGRDHVDDVARSLAGKAADVRLLTLEVKEKGDVSDWLDAGHDVDELRAMLREAPPYRAPEPPAGMVGMDAADLLDLDLPELRWIVPDLLPEGTTILAAPPKVGKSCLIYQIAVEAAIGGELLGRRVTPGSVLYFALEDGKRRGQGRLRAALAGRTMPRGRLEVRWSSRKIGQGLEDDIAAWLDSHPDAVMVAIDTLGKVRPKAAGRRDVYDLDVENLARLQDLFRDGQVALVIVHHARKEGHDDFIASVSGTYGITGSADTIVVVKRPRLESFGTIYVSGRDVPDAELPVRFDGLVWQSAPAAVSQASFERRQVYEVIEAEGPIFPAKIAERTGQQRTSVQNMVTAMADDRVITRVVGGYVVSASRARIDHVPHDSNDSGSHQGYGRYPPYARARTDDPPPLTRPAVYQFPDRVDCIDHVPHQRSHRYDGVRWVCDICTPTMPP